LKGHKVSVLLTIKEAAKRLSLSQSKVYRMTIDGELESIHIGRAVRVPEKAVDDLINQQRPSFPDYLKGDDK
jgi:excisionase family DNA binding protein